MKTLVFLAGLVALCLTSGCMSLGKNMADFVAKLPPNTLTDATQTTSTPVYSHQESVTGMSKSADGTIVISNLKANAAIPELGVTWGLSISGLTISPAGQAATAALQVGTALVATPK